MSKPNFFVTNALIGLLILAMIGLGLNYWLRPWWKQWEAKQAVEKSIAPRQADEGSGQLKNALTVAQSDRHKLTQLLWVGVTAVQTPATQSGVASGSAAVNIAIDPTTQTWLETEQPGFVQFMGKQATTTSAVTSVTRDQYGSFQTQLAKLTADWTWQPLLTVWPAATGATILRGEDAVTLPTMAELCLAQAGVESRVANAAAQLSSLKTALIVGPFVDLGTTGYQGGRMCGDLQKTTEAAARFIENFGAESVLSVVGHFPGLGSVAVDPKNTPTTVATTVTDLKPFQQLFTKYLNLGVLVSPIRVAEKFDGKPCSQSAECLANFATQYTQVLVIADGVDSTGALAGQRSSGVTTGASGSATTTQTLTLAESMKQSLLAGSDVLILEKTNNWQAINQALAILEQEMVQNPQLKQAVERSWKKVMTLRTGPAQ